MPDTAVNSWDNFWAQFETFNQSLANSRAVNVNTHKLRDSAKTVVQTYFTKVRPELRELKIPETDLGPLDAELQNLLRYANTTSAKKSYSQILHRIKAIRTGITIKRDTEIGQHADTIPTQRRTDLENQVIQTLEKMVPTAAESYKQVLYDLTDSSRISFRGTANEIRETLREVLDYLAPDKDVQAMTGFQLEQGQTKPTMKQKVRFILKMRGLPQTARGLPEKTTELIDDSRASIARATYERASIAAHTAGTKEEVKQMKIYLDAILSEVLELTK